MPWFDPLEAGVRQQLRLLIEGLLEEELTAVLKRARYERDVEPMDTYRIVVPGPQVGTFRLDETAGDLGLTLRNGMGAVMARSRSAGRGGDAGCRWRVTPVSGAPTFPRGTFQVPGSWCRVPGHTMEFEDMTSSDAMRDILVAGLHNTHALEMEALQIMNRQVDRLQNYPELEQALRLHIRETEQQRQRIEEAMSEMQVSPSTIKEAIFGLMGNVTAVVHAAAKDEILKNMFSNHAFENYEIAAYKSLIVMAEAAGFRNITGFQQSLREEEAMAQKMRDMIEPITRKYISLEQQEVAASR